MSQLSFSDEQRQFRDFVARFFREQSPVTRARELMLSESGYDPELWRRLGGELGLTGVHVPEAYGGQGFGAVELGIVLEEMGRVVYCGPYFGSAVLATYALLEGATAAQQERWLPPLAAADIIGSLALAEPGGGWEAGAVQASARKSAGRWRLEGTKSYVLDGQIADLFIIAARELGSAGPEAVSLFAVQAGAPGLEVEPLQTVDATRPLSRLRLSGVDAELLGEPGAAEPVLRRVLDRAAVALASEMVGGAQALLDSAVSYAKLRVQFGRLIGSFQAIKHKCADMLLAVELAKSAAYGAAEAAAREASVDELREAAALAKALGAEAFLQAAADTIQIHGGIGFTWENDTHLYFKRARGSEVLLGTPAAFRDRFVEYVSAREVAHE
ncbi:MAG: acyl-CoA dehydrogenase family protein [Pseudomonadales bacterium]